MYFCPQTIRHSCFDGCRLENIKRSIGFERLSFDILNSEGGKLAHISVSNPDVDEKLRQLLDKRRLWLFLSCGMADLDIWQKSADMFCVEWSPAENAVSQYFVNRKELSKLIAAS